MHEPRPLPLSPSVVARAADRMVTAIEELRQFTASPEIREKALAAVTRAITTHTDAFDRCQLLFADGLGPCEDVLKIVAKKSGHERFALIEEEIAWVMRNGIRFPGRDGDRMTVAIDMAAVLVDVVAVRGSQARAIVKTVPGGAQHDVPAENCMKVWRDGVGTAVRHQTERGASELAMVGG
jgi:hypothetical protein